jgi:hypothetical protein
MALQHRPLSLPFDMPNLWSSQPARYFTISNLNTSYDYFYLAAMFWRTHHTKFDPKSIRVMPLCLWGVYTRLD